MALLDDFCECLRKNKLRTAQARRTPPSRHPIGLVSGPAAACVPARRPYRSDPIVESRQQGLASGYTMLPMRLVVATVGMLLSVLLSSATGLLHHGDHDHQAAVHAYGHSHGSSHEHHHAHTHGLMPASSDEALDSVHHGETDDHHCCHAHHHEPEGDEPALPGRQRDSVPASAAVLSTDDAWRLIAAPKEHRQLWPFARARPPDHLICLRTVVLLT